MGTKCAPGVIECSERKYQLTSSAPPRKATAAPSSAGDIQARGLDVLLPVADMGGSLRVTRPPRPPRPEPPRRFRPERRSDLRPVAGRPPRAAPGVARAARLRRAARVLSSRSAAGP